MPDSRKQAGSSRVAASIFFTWLSLLVTGLLSGCAQVRHWIVNSTPTAPAHGAVLFADDFSEIPNGWGVNVLPETAVSYEQGGLRILIREAQTDAWSVAGKDFSDAVVEVTARRLDGPDNNLIGLICRYQDRQNFYMLFVSSDGYYGIGLQEKNSYRLLGVEQLQYSPVIQASQAEYRVRAICQGSELVLYLGDWKLFEVTDDTFKDGDVGVIAGAYDTPGVDILFDDFSVSQP